MGLREDLLPAVQAIRNIAVDLGIRRYEVWVRLVTYSGTRVGLGTATTTDTYLGRPKVREVSSKDIIAGTEMGDVVYEIGPFTPESAALTLPDTKSLSPYDLSPVQTSNPTEIYYLVKGPGLPTAGLLCQRVKDDLDKPFRYMVTVKGIGRKAT